jgi:hypothetical protein
MPRLPPWRLPSPRARQAAAAAIILTSPLGVAPAAPAAALQNGGVAFAGKRLGKPVIYMRSPDRRGLRVVPTGGWAQEPAVSPGGRRVAFSRRGRLSAQIWTGYLDGTGLVQLTGGPEDHAPRWSPTGDAVVFARGAVGRRDVYTVRADGGGLRRLTLRSSDDHSPVWSAGGRIAFVRRARGQGDIYDIAAAGGKPRQLTSGPADDRSPAWSPGGRRLAFARGRPGRRDLYLLRADSSRQHRLTALSGEESEPAWSPDGRWLVFTHRRAGRRRLYLLRLRGRPVRRFRSRRLRALTSARAEPSSPDWQRAGLAPVVAAAGDIACDPTSAYFAGGLGSGRFCRQRQTSDLLLRMDLAAILAAGDLQYEDGQLWKFQQSFDPSWGRLKALIRPTPGNHEYQDPGAAGYFDYFNGPGQDVGPAGWRDRGYYSFDVGSWHLIALNSECGQVGGCGAGQPQERWLRDDLARHAVVCTLAFWHHPRFTSGRHSAEGAMLAAWNALYEAGVDVVVNGHEHVYERFAPQTPAGGPDPARGIRQFIVGTGGKSRFGFVTVAPNSELRENRRMGVLRLTLAEGRYGWEFVTTPAGWVADAGEASCH